MALREVHLVGGTLPEAVKLAPVVLAMRTAGLLAPVLLAADRDAATVAPALAAFGLAPDITLRAENTTAGRAELLSAMIRELDELWSVRTPAAVIVQGDTTTSLAGALAAFWRRIPVVHLEAGLRSDDLTSPFPEEGDRRLIAQATALHLAPTPLAAMNLLDERIPASDVLITGSTLVDAALALAGYEPPLANPEVAALLDSRTRHDPMAAGGTPYGDGLAAARTAQATAALLGLAPAPEAMPVPAQTALTSLTS